MMKIIVVVVRRDDDDGRSSSISDVGALKAESINDKDK